MIFRYMRESKMEDKDKSFIANHNIIRPIEYPLIAMPFLTTLTFVFYTIFYIVSSDKTSGESVLYIVGVIFSIITFVFSMWLRRKYLKAFNEEPGKSMYAAEAWQYMGFVLHTSLLMLSFFSWEEVQISLLTSICFLVAIIVITIAVTIIVVKKRIGKGFYQKNKDIGTKTMRYLGSGSFIAIMLFIKSIVINSEADGLTLFICILLVALEFSIVLAVEYFLKLKYAKEYELEDYLPTRPHPSEYTGWR